MPCCSHVHMYVNLCMYWRASLKNHDKKIENNNNTTETNSQCNCRDKSTCPYMENCLKKCGIQSHCKDKQLNKIPYRLNGGNRQRIYAHKVMFSNKKEIIELYKHTFGNWNTRTLHWAITREVIKSAPAYNKISRRCLLSLHLFKSPTHQQYTLLNYKSKIISKCQHEKKHLLSQFDPKI